MTAPCSDVARTLDEPLMATASRVERWLLVEHCGAWGPQSVPLGRMPRAAGAALTAAAHTSLARLVLIRRPGRPHVADHGRWVFAVDSRSGRERVLARHVEHDAELETIVPPFGTAATDGWEPRDGRLWLVCTHGRKDRCCAVRGRPTAQALAEQRPDDVWECTHVGGDRFSPNLVVLPEGLYLGHVEAADVVGIAAGVEAGRLPAGYVRGRSSLALPVQAAQHFAREATGRWASDDLAPVVQELTGPDVWRVVLAGAGGPDLEAVVRYDPAGDGPARELTCGADQLKTSPLFRLVSLVP